ncbi:hypothetical protein ACEUCJ_20390 [Aeromonas rivipollensis]|uniref:hypothetical protein n=1 Tax=Aeromonas rivipollensis TaxID=948519 RepID=UPI0038CFD082
MPPARSAIDRVVVLAPELLVQSMDMEMLKWLVAFIVIYTSWTMYASWQAARRQP